MSPTPVEGALGRVRAWWRSRQPATRQRVVLATLAAASLAARDVLLLGFSAALLLVTELARPAVLKAKPGAAE